MRCACHLFPKNRIREEFGQRNAKTNEFRPIFADPRAAPQRAGLAIPEFRA
jgi:hypothetical protein